MSLAADPDTVMMFTHEEDDFPTSVLFPAGTPTFIQEAIFGSLREWRFDTPVEAEYRRSGLYTIHMPWALRIIGEYLLSLTVTIHRKRLDRGWAAVSREAEQAVRKEDVEALWGLLDESRHVPWSYQIEAWRRAASRGYQTGELALNPYRDHQTSAMYILADIVAEAWARVKDTVYVPEPEEEEDWE